MAPENVTVIGRGARVHGRVTGQASLEIHGLVEGEVAVDGDLTVGESGLIASDLSGRRVVVRGAVKGNVTGEESVHIEDGAKVVGDVRAPRVAIAAGALVRGYVQTAGMNGNGARPRTTTASAPKAAPKSIPSPVAAVRPSAPRAALLSGARPAPSAPAPASTAPAPSSTAPVSTNHAPPAPSAAKKAPPAPVVPALKKGAKGALAKKR